MPRKKGVPGVTFSAKRALGISQAQAKLSRKLGVPLTRAGRQRKMGKAMGCSVVLALPLLGLVIAGSAALFGSFT
jgi:hypothetical protein